MWCGICNTDVKDCTCPDADERLKAITHVAFKWCSKCDKHYARCRCESPVFVMRIGDKRSPLPAGVV